MRRPNLDRPASPHALSALRGLVPFLRPYRGRIALGAKADLVLFDAANIKEGNSFVDPCRHPSGIEYVFVNGVAAVSQGRETGALAGRVLRKK